MTDTMSNELIARGPVLSIIAELDKRDSEIERLREELAVEKGWVSQYRDSYCKQVVEIERLRGELAALQTHFDIKVKLGDEKDAEIERLNYLHTEQAKTIRELMPENERLRDALEAITVVGFGDGAAGSMAKIALRALRVREVPGVRDMLRGPTNREENPECGPMTTTT